ncbi:hypothetical protein J7L48_06650 [bacterium]|nr:hypothetical protein [bacterium]
MIENEYKTMYKVESSHWWYRGLRKIAKPLLKDRISSNSNIQILDLESILIPLISFPFGLSIMVLLKKDYQKKNMFSN